jgi:hypothetical protein
MGCHGGCALEGCATELESLSLPAHTSSAPQILDLVPSYRRRADGACKWPLKIAGKEGKKEE